MDVTPLIRRDTKIIQSYRDGVFKISGQVYPHGVFILSDRVMPWQPVMTDIKSLTENDFAALEPHGAAIDVLLLGTGSKLFMPQPLLRIKIKDRFGFTLEAMDSGAASRTYNVLIAEGRRIAAALLPWM